MFLSATHFVFAYNAGVSLRTNYCNPQLQSGIWLSRTRFCHSMHNAAVGCCTQRRSKAIWTVSACRVSPPEQSETVTDCDDISELTADSWTVLWDNERAYLKFWTQHPADVVSYRLSVVRWTL